MSQSTNGGHFYQIHGSGNIAQAIRKIHGQALREGRGREVAEALHVLQRRLQMNPGNLGEALYRLAALRLQLRTVVIGPLVVNFGVHEVRPLVFIKGVRLLSKS